LQMVAGRGCALQTAVPQASTRCTNATTKSVSCCRAMTSFGLLLVVQRRVILSSIDRTVCLLSAALVVISNAYVRSCWLPADVTVVKLYTVRAPGGVPHERSDEWEHRTKYSYLSFRQLRTADSRHNGFIPHHK
jgi:hypothetical protein